MTKHTEDKPATVPLAQQAGEKPAPWRWVEPSVWTIRMLTALEQGVEGGKWFRLFDNKRRGCAKGWDFHQWPNAFFADFGLFSLVTAHYLACQSLTR